MRAPRLADPRRPAGAAPRAGAATAGAETIAVLASSRRRGEALVRLLRVDGLAAVVVDAERLGAGIRDGTAAVAVVTIGMLRSPAGRALLRVVDEQPAWSDFPFVIVSARGDRIDTASAERSLNAVVISRPVRCEALVSAARSAIRARWRQRQAATAGDPRPPADREADRAQRQRARALELYVSRVSAMGEMASTLAHEVNQPLSTITNYVAGCRQLLASAAAAGAAADLRPLFGALAIAEAETMRAGEILRRMRETVAVADAARRPTRVADIVAHACRIVLVDEPAVPVDVDVAPLPMDVAVDGVAIQHVIVSLVHNCRAGVRGRPLDRILIAARPGKPGFVELRVSDARPGGDANSGADPFSAVGVHREDDVRIRLAICRTIVEAHGGAIATDGVGADACFAFTLPLAVDARPRA